MGSFVDGPTGVSSAIQMYDPTSLQDFNPFACPTAKNPESCVLEKAEAQGFFLAKHQGNQKFAAFQEP